MEGGIEDMAFTKYEVKSPVAEVQWRTASMPSDNITEWSNVVHVML